MRRLLRELGWSMLVWLAFLPGQLVAQDQPPPRQQSERPNILWLIAEDFGCHLGCYGTKEVQTPHLDRLAAQGVRYTRFFTTCPVCSPSRSAFITGMYQTTIGAHHHRSHRDDGYSLPVGVKIATDWFRQGGYFAGNIRHFPAPIAFKGTAKTDWNFQYKGEPFDTDAWSDLKNHQPFFAQVNFHETHRKFNGPSRADPQNVELPPYYPDHPIAREDWARYLDAASELDRKIGLILRLLEKDGLAENTVIVFFGDNGEAHVRGKQWCYDSGLKVPLIIYWPKGRTPPKHFKPGSTDDRLLAAIDLLPTMLSLAQQPKPAGMQGRIFLGDAAESPRDYVFGARDRCDMTVAKFRTVRGRRYRYIRNYMPERPFLQFNRYKETQYPVWNLLKKLHEEGKLNAAQAVLAQPRMPAEELYDLERDPHEIVNLAESPKPEHEEMLQKLRRTLEEWIVSTQDKGQEAESPELAKSQGVTKPGTNPSRDYAWTPREKTDKAGKGP